MLTARCACVVCRPSACVECALCLLKGASSASLAVRPLQTAAPQQPARSTQPGAERDALSVRQAADEIDDPATSSHSRQIGIGHIPAEPLWMLLGRSLIAVACCVYQIQQPARRPICVDAV